MTPRALDGRSLLAYAPVMHTEPLSLQHLRDQRGVSRTELAAASGRTRRQIKDWELRLSAMGAADCHAVSEALGLFPAERAGLLAWAAERPAAGEGA